jgi:hypothetical protein
MMEISDNLDHRCVRLMVKPREGSSTWSRRDRQIATARVTLRTGRWSAPTSGPVAPWRGCLTRAGAREAPIRPAASAGLLPAHVIIDRHSRDGCSSRARRHQRGADPSRVTPCFEGSRLQLHVPRRGRAGATPRHRRA